MSLPEAHRAVAVNEAGLFCKLLASGQDSKLTGTLAGHILNVKYLLDWSGLIDPAARAL
ncbi:MAG: hypothetical protein M3R59_11620 [Verrucomicrobiota bacterium]|nr:hypothetical protein [Verrucomicrobiota bacterium]